MIIVLFYFFIFCSVEITHHKVATATFNNVTMLKLKR